MTSNKYISEGYVCENDIYLMEIKLPQPYRKGSCLSYYITYTGDIRYMSLFASVMADNANMLLVQWSTGEDCVIINYDVHSNEEALRIVVDAYSNELSDLFMDNDIDEQNTDYDSADIPLKKITADDLIEVAKWKQLLDDGIITEEEFARKRKEYIGI